MVEKLWTEPKRHSNLSQSLAPSVCWEIRLSEYIINRKTQGICDIILSTVFDKLVR